MPAKRVFGFTTFSIQSLGFTLVELLVVISIIAILAIIGLTIFTNVTKSSRDARRKADIDSISKAYEVKYLTNSQYNAQSPSDFSQNVIPKPPENSSSDYFNFLASDHSGYLACAALEAHPTRTCNSTSPTCYCQSSTQGKIVSTIPDGGSTNVSIGFTGNGLQHPALCDPNGTLDDGIVAYWKLDEASWPNNCSSAAVFDISGFANNGKSCPNATGPTGGVAGKSGNSGSFDGVDDYISTSYSPDLTSGFTFNFWINPSSLTGDHALVGSTASGTNTEIRIRSANSLEVTLGGYTDGVNAYRSIPINILINTWVMLTSTFDGSVVKVYQNGSFIGSKTLTAPNAIWTPSLALGRRDGFNNEYFAGLIDDARLYNRALSPTEVTSLYNGGNGCIP